MEDYMNKLAMLCSATDATLLFEAKMPPANAIRKGKRPFMRFTICNKHGEVLLHEETQDDIIAACRLTLYAYEDYIMHNGIQINLQNL